MLGNIKYKPVQTLYYSPADGKAHVTYAGGEDMALGTGQDIYFVYYQKKDLTVSYKSMAADGTLSNVTVTGSGTPAELQALGDGDLADSITAPIANQQGSS